MRDGARPHLKGDDDVGNAIGDFQVLFAASERKRPFADKGPAVASPGIRLTRADYGDIPIIVDERIGRVFSPCHCNVLRKAARHVSHAYDLALQPTGLKTTQFSLLAAIERRREVPPTMQELAEVMVMDRSTLGHNLRPLERDHLVKLGTKASDRRSRWICLTRKGRRKLREAAQFWREMQKRFELGFGPERTARLREDLLVLATMKFPQS